MGFFYRIRKPFNNGNRICFHLLRMPQNKPEYLKAINRFLKLQISKEKELKEIIEMAADICNAPYAEISILDHETQYVKFTAGIPITGEGFKNIEPLITNDGINIGTLCVSTTKIEKLNDLQILMLKSLSRQVTHLLEFEENLSLLKDQFVASKIAETKLKAFFESSSSCHLLLDHQLDIVSFNKAMADLVFKIYEFKFSENLKVDDYIHPDFLESFKKYCYAALRGEFFVEERHLHYPFGLSCWYTTFDPAYNSNGEIIGVSFTATDITRKVKHEELLGLQSESFQRIAHIQTHDLVDSIHTINLLMNTIAKQDSLKDIKEIQLLGSSVTELNTKNKIVV